MGFGNSWLLIRSSSYSVKLWHFESTIAENRLAIGQYFEFVSGGEKALRVMLLSNLIKYRRWTGITQFSKLSG